jgi:predicted RNA-binding Zn ribbon-like protein
VARFPRYISSNQPFCRHRLQCWVVPSTVQATPGYEFDLSGGVVCLDFANTVSQRKTPERTVDHLGSYDDFVVFAEQSGILSREHGEELRALSRRKHRLADAALRRALAYRENVYRAFSALAEGKPPDSGDVQQINDFVLEALNHRQLEPADGHYRWEWQWNNKNALDRILWPIAQSAADLLTSPELYTVRMCEAPDCAWLFLDQSRNRTRRWCDMKVCGNRQKARRHYQRTHQ